MAYEDLDDASKELLGLPPGPTAPVRLAPSQRTGEKSATTFGDPYDGANRFDRDLALWNPSMGSADYDMLWQKPLIDARVRDTLRNDAYVVNASRIRQDSIVGSVYFLNSKPATRVLGKQFDDTWEEEFQEEVEAKFMLWAESPNKWVDAARRNTLTDLVRLAVAGELSDGEVLASSEWLRDRGRPFHTAIQMLDIARLDTPPMFHNDRLVRRGVRRNHYGAPISYFIRRAHPSDWMDPMVNQWKEVKARKPWGRRQIIHIFEQQRPDQTRGISDLVSALKQLRQASKFRDVSLQNAIINATFAATIESEFKEEAFDALGAQSASDFEQTYLGGVAQYFQHAGNIKLDGARVPVMYPGTRLQLRPAGSGGPLGSDFEASMLRYFAAATGISYEEISRDYTGTNYASIRAAAGKAYQSLQVRKIITADRFATMVYWLWLEEALNEGLIESLPNVAKNPTFFYTDNFLNLMFEAIGQCDWIGASRGQIDELKETQAAVLRLKMNLTSYEQEMSRLGQDWRKVLKQRAREKEMIEELGLEPDEKDDMMNALSGTPQVREKDDEPDDGSEDNTEVADE
jgi:lambda family phage portal protein